MPITKQLTLYSFDELSDEAKERARAWLRECIDKDAFWSEAVITDFETVAGFCGWDINRRPYKTMGGETRYEPIIYWSGFGSQGDGACFEGTFRATDINAQALREHAPEDKQLQRLANAFENFKNKQPHGKATVVHKGHYMHEYCTEFGTKGFDHTLHEVALIEDTRILMRWLYDALATEYMYQMSNECIDESIVANGYEFTVTGKIHIPEKEEST